MSQQTWQGYNFLSVHIGVQSAKCVTSGVVVFHAYYVLDNLSHDTVQLIMFDLLDLWVCLLFVSENMYM